MNKWIAAATGLMAVTVVAHVFGGGPEVNEIVSASNLPPTVRSLSSVVWHGITLMLVFATLALAYLARQENLALEAFLAAWQLGLAALFIGYGHVQLGTVWLMPQWIVFIAIPLMTYVGSQRRTANR